MSRLLPMHLLLKKGLQSIASIMVSPALTMMWLVRKALYLFKIVLLILSISSFFYAPMTFAVTGSTSFSSPNPSNSSGTDSNDIPDSSDGSGGASVQLGGAFTAAPDASTMMVKLAASIPTLMQLVTAIAYVMGMFLVIRAVIELKHLGEARSMMSSERHGMAKPAALIFVGASLLYIPTAIHMGMSTFFTSANPYAYATGGQGQWCTVLQDFFLVVQLIGVIAFIRGLMMLTQVGGHGGQPGTFAKGLTYIIAGIFCVDMYDFVNVVMTTLGMTANWCFGT
jgi:intracellular multiplication protein IcmC